MMGALWKRILVLVLSVIVIAMLLSSSLFFLFTQNYFVNIKYYEVAPQANAIARAVLENDMHTGDFFSGDAIDLFGYTGFIYITDNEKNPIGYYSSSASVTRETFAASVEEYMPEVLQGREIVSISKSNNNAAQYFVIGVPIRVAEETEVLGTVFIYKPMTEVMGAQQGFYNALGMAVLLTLPITFVAVQWIARRVANPINRMRTIATRMAAGDFSLRADEQQRGELGQLAYALNFLSLVLSKTLSTLTFERNRLRLILDSLNEGILAIDADGAIMQANPALFRLFGIVMPRVIPNEVSVLAPDFALAEYFTRAMQTKSMVMDQIRRGSAVLQIVITPLENENEIVGAVCLVQDITESERLEQTRREYVANVSHELRTPLTAMRGLLEPLSDGLVTQEEARTRYYAILMRETLRLSRLIEDLMQLSRLQSGQMSFAAELFDLETLLKDLVYRYQEQIDEKQLEIFVDAQKLPLVFANEDRVEQILIILLDNALKFTPQNGKITFTAKHAPPEKILVQVQDNGPGIPEEDIEHVFERFYTADKSRHMGGTGIGLSIAREMIVQMNETIEAGNAPEGGAWFAFTLPVQSVLMEPERDTPAGV